MGRSNAPVLWFSKNWTSSGVGAIISAGSDYIDIGLGFLRARPNQLRCSTAKPTKREAVTAFKAKREKRLAAHRS
jgi:hypothetical protein